MRIPTTLTATVLLSTLALAQTPPSTDPDPPPVTKATFESLDRNSDQRLSQTEAAADDTVSSQFASLDANSDGYLNRNEYSQASTNIPMPPREPLPDPDEEPEDPGA